MRMNIFTIQNVPIKLWCLVGKWIRLLNLQYKMFLLNDGDVN